ncbi:MAG: cytochrome P450 [Actinomycetota bacterium]|nr:cytochrome P450 [Actinomycetota bacterium]
MTTGCPVHFDPLDPTYLADPTPVWEQLRRDAPVHYNDELDMWVVSRHADVESVFRDPVTFSAANAQDPMYPLHPEAQAVLAEGWVPLKTMSNADGEYHARNRRFSLVGFTPRRLRALEPIVRQTTRALIDKLAAAGPGVDFVSALAFPLPATIIFTLLGFPPEDTDRLKEWASDRLSFSWGRPSAVEQARVASDMVAYRGYCDAHVARRLVEPADDFTSDLLQFHRESPESFTLAEAAHIIFGFSFAGHETTTNLLANALHRCLTVPRVWAMLVADPTAIAGAVEETLRFDSSVVAWRRVTTTKTVIGESEVPAGARVLVLLGSANHDPEVFEQPGRFDVSRTDSRYLSFGWGKHYCIGASLAKLELQVVLEELTARFPQLGRADDEPLRYHPNVSFRGPQRLSLTWPDHTGTD